MTGIQHNRPDGTGCQSLAVTSCSECGWTEPVRDGEASPSVADGLPSNRGADLNAFADYLERLAAEVTGEGDLGAGLELAANLARRRAQEIREATP